MIITNIDTENDNKLNKSKKTNRFCLVLSADKTPDFNLRLKSIFRDFSVEQIAASDSFTFGGEKALIVHDGEIPEQASTPKNNRHSRYSALNYLLPSVYFTLEEAKKAGDRLMSIDKEETYAFEKELFNSYMILDSDKVNLRSAPFYFDKDYGLAYPAEKIELTGTSDDKKLDTLYELISAIIGKENLLSYQKISGSKIKSQISITLEDENNQEKTVLVFADKLDTMSAIQYIANKTIEQLQKA